MGNRRVSVGVDADVSPFVRSLGTAAAATRGFSRELESADSRLSNLVQTGLALAPALVPLGAAAVPALAGLTLQLGLAAGAASVAVLAFHGIGDALKALDAYQMKPTTQNLAKLQTELDKLGPAGQEFVVAIDKMRPEFQRMQDLAQAGLLPGVTDSLEEILGLAPQVSEVIYVISGALGDLARDAGKGLNSADLQQFFEYLDVTARPVLTEMGHTFGNFLAGFANTVVAFDPLSRSFSTGLLELSERFREATSNLDDSEGFQAFVEYIQESGPRALDALESIGNALIQLVEAAAPVGSVALPVISALADGLAAIADSPVGPVLITAAAAVGTLGRSLALLRAVGLRGDGEGIVAQSIGANKLKGAVTSMRELSAATAEYTLAQRALGQERGLVSAGIGNHDDYAAAVGREAKASERMKVATEQRSVALREGAAQLGRSAALVGGLALATSGLADNTGLANTASLALMGTIAGPWGAALGGGVGLVMDLAAANNHLEAAMRAVQQAGTNPVNFVAQVAGLDAAQSKVEAYQKYVSDAWKPGGGNGNVMHDFKQGFTAISDLWSNAGSDAEDSQLQQQQAVAAMRQNLAELYGALNGGDTALLQGPAEQVQAFANQIAPALQAAGLSFEDIGRKPEEAARAVRDFAAGMAGATDNSRALDDAMAYLNGTTTQLTTVTDLNSDGIVNNTDAILANIDAMKDRADAAVAAFDAETAYQRSLNEGKDRDKEKGDIQQQIRDEKARGDKERADLRKQLASGAGDTGRRVSDLRDQLASAKSPEQRKAIQGRIADAQRGAGEDAAKIRERIAQSFTDQAKRVKDLTDRLAEYANTLDKTTVAGQKNRDLLSGMADSFNNLSDKQKNAKGRYEEARAALIDQAKEFGATDRQAKHFADTLLQIPPRVVAKIALEKQRAQEALDAFSKAFDELDGKTAKAFVELREKHIGTRLDRGAGNGAAGSYFEGGYTGPGGKYEPAGIVHRKEFVSDAETTANARPILEALHASKGRLTNYDRGGYVGQGRSPQGAPGWAMSAGGLSSADLDRITAALLAVRPRIGHLHVADGTDVQRVLTEDARSASLEGGR